jgi:hypothetical protein
LAIISHHIPDPKAKAPTTPQPPPKAQQDAPPPSSTLPEQTSSHSDDIVITQDDLERWTSKPLSKRLLAALHDNPTNLPEVPPAYTPGACEKRTQFDALKLHKIFGCRKFKTQ